VHGQAVGKLVDPQVAVPTEAPDLPAITGHS